MNKDKINISFNGLSIKIQKGIETTLNTKNILFKAQNTDSLVKMEITLLIV